MANDLRTPIGSTSSISPTIYRISVEPTKFDCYPNTYTAVISVPNGYMFIDGEAPVTYLAFLSSCDSRYKTLRLFVRQWFSKAGSTDIVIDNTLAADFDPKNVGPNAIPYEYGTHYLVTTKKRRGYLPPFCFSLVYKIAK